jgi:precorrin-2/cobalt-factor-2 C20-methyltransferase
MSDRIGVLYGVSVGTSDPELITVKGLKALQTAPIIAFPAGIQGRKGMAETIIEGYVRSHQHQLPLDFPYVQDEATLSEAWNLAAETVWQYLQQGQDVVFVSEGDVSFYSTFTYLAEGVRSRHPDVKIETIPGVCSPLAAAATLGIPLTIRSQKLAILPALYNVAELETALNWAEVVVLMKVSSVYSEVWQVLEKHQLLEHSYIVERATSQRQIIYQGLEGRSTLELPYFSILIVKVRNK